MALCSSNTSMFSPPQWRAVAMRVPDPGKSTAEAAQLPQRVATAPGCTSAAGGYTPSSPSVFGSPSGGEPLAFTNDAPAYGERVPAAIERAAAIAALAHLRTKIRRIMLPRARVVE